MRKALPTLGYVAATLQASSQRRKRGKRSSCELMTSDGDDVKSVASRTVEIMRQRTRG